MPGTSSTNGPSRRVTSTRLRDSILTTSAPRWASCIAANGPAHTHVMSTTRSPASGRRGAAAPGVGGRGGPVDAAVVLAERRDTSRRGRRRAGRRMRIGDAGASTPIVRRRGRGRGTNGARAAAPTPAPRWASGPGTPARRRRGRVRQEVVDRERRPRPRRTSASTTSYCSTRWAVVANTSRWPHSGSPSIVTSACHCPSSVHCTSNGAVAARRRSPTGTRRGRRRRRAPARRRSPSAGTVAIVVTIASSAATSMRWPSPSAQPGVQRAERRRSRRGRPANTSVSSPRRRIGVAVRPSGSSR